MYLYEVIKQVAIDLNQLKRVANEYEFTASGAGSATTTVNSNFAATNVNEPPEEDFFKNHAIFITYDAGAAAASPEGRWGSITAYDETTYTLTHSTLTDATASGDKFFIISQSLFPISAYVTACNRALKDLGAMTFVDRSLTTAADQTEYSLPTGVIELLDVRVQTNTSDANDNRYMRVNGCRLVPPTTTLSTAPILYVPQQVSGRTLEIHYNGLHPVVSAYNDVIWKYVQSPLIVNATKKALLEQFLNGEGQAAQQHWRNMYDEATQQTEYYKRALPVPIRKKRRDELSWGPYQVDDFGNATY